MMLKKLKLLYLPYIIIIVGLLVLYSFINWFFIIRTNHYFVREMVVNVAIPSLLAGIALLLWLSPNLSLLRKAKISSNFRWFCIIVAFLAIIIPTIFFQYYLHASLGKLTRLDSCEHLQAKDISKYYQFEHYYVDKSAIGVYPSFYISGRYNDKLNMSLYVALPIHADEYRMADSRVMAWLGKSFHKTINNRESEDEKEKQFRQFVVSTLHNLDNTDLNHPGYLERADHLYNFHSMQKAMQKSPKYQSGQSTLFIEYDIPFAERAEKYKDHFTLSLYLLGGLWLMLVLFSKMDETALVTLNTKGARNSVLTRAKKYPITCLLISINCLLYLVMFFKGLGFDSFDGDDLLTWGANFRLLTTDNQEWWRLFTSMFIHNGLMHLISNMFALFLSGIILEPLIGRGKYLVLYLITGIIASSTSVWWHEASVSVGASGAIFGLFGILIALLVEKHSATVFTVKSMVLTQIIVYASLGLIMGLLGYIDNAAHIGGLVCGLGVGLVLRFGKRSNLFKNEIDCIL